MRISSDRLGLVLFGKGKRAILSQVMGNPDKRFFVRELARTAGLTASTLTRDLSALAEAGVLLRTQEGRQVYYQANPSSPVFPELRGLITKTFGIADVLREMLVQVAAKIAVAAVYGSVARGEHSSASDVDLLVIGNLRTSEFADELMRAEKILARSINPTIYTPAEFATAALKNPFVKAILDKPMIFILGEAHELKRVRKGSASNAR